MPRPTKKRETARLTLAVSPEIKELMENLRDETGADSLSEVVRRSLAVYEFFWNETDDSKKIIIRDEEGNDTPVHLIWA
mgnify:CR=1 FL=1|tara:strand:+ start:704 stop:940 length:237 start_codon:yes stop_codon:yes gene_type:complete